MYKCGIKECWKTVGCSGVRLLKRVKRLKMYKYFSLRCTSVGLRSVGLRSVGRLKDVHVN